MKKIFGWFKNYFYYYKTYIIVGAIILAILIAGIISVVSRESYDYTVYLCVSANASSEFQNSVKAAVSQYGDDVDGDGKISVQLINLSYDFTDPAGSEATAKAVLLAGELQTGGNFVFFYDEFYYEKAFSGLFEKHDFLTQKEQTAFSLEGTDIEAYMKAGLSSVGFDAESLPEMYMSIRKEPEQTQDSHATYLNDYELFCNIINNKQTAIAAK